ncbi:hypothetical protein SK128_023783 [Halocaridina rubra]|uniref:Uncharacterized protein n=1 Tax=Halocaridina rubra TaxID=373956 RepID=A0AAN8WUV9_HALRR
MPGGREKYTKVIIFDVSTYLSPEDLAFDDRFMWIKRREVKIKGKVEHKPQLIALMQGTQPNVWQQRLEQCLADQASLSQDNITEVQGNVPARQQKIQVNADAAWMREINDLKKIIVDMRKQVINLHSLIATPSARMGPTVGAAVVESVSGAAIDSTVDATAGGSTEGPAVSTVVDVAVGTDTANVMGNSMASKEVNDLMNVVIEVRSLLKSVRTYVDNPKGKLKSKMLQCLSSVENKIHHNGG